MELTVGYFSENEMDLLIETIKTYVEDYSYHEKWYDSLESFVFIANDNSAITTEVIEYLGSKLQLLKSDGGQYLMVTLDSELNIVEKVVTYNYIQDMNYDLSIILKNDAEYFKESGIMDKESGIMDKESGMKIHIENIEENKKLTLENDLKQFAKDNYLKVVEQNGSLYVLIDMHIDYRDEDVIINNIYQSIDNVPKNYNIVDKVIDELIESMIDLEWELINHAINEFIKEFPQHKKDDDEWYEFLYYYFSVDYRDLRKVVNNTALDVNISLNFNDDSNQEFANNNIDYLLETCNDDNYEEYLNFMEESSIKQLIELQGYTIKEFYNYLQNEKDKKDNTFFNSLIEEIQNVTSYTTAITVLARMTLREYSELLESETVVIAQDSFIGFVDFIQGSGSILELKLNKDMKIERENLHICIDGQYGYSVQEIYGGLDYQQDTVKYF